MPAADGLPNIQIEKTTGFSAPTVLKWRKQYLLRVSKGCVMRRVRAREPEIDELALIAETLPNDGKPPAELGSRTGPRASWPSGSGSSFPRGPDLAQVEHPAARPRDVQVLNRSQLEAKLRDVVGLHMSPPENAVAVRIDEKSHIPALDRTHADRPLSPDHASRQTHDYKRNGTMALSRPCHRQIL
ncbi:hypothetical protein QFZ79_000902 [Arthrobacter sp. V4I6]|uniref:hypothetical protein n=1 Tax=Arthrobacter sp. V4I6 TaxID=3042281 RepID=UPI00278718E4|nr:hypothetical protein [Arthrobacter sp. V4I6]MDQ0852791.1 hypothetical protein [Arthrobacter sp. V4I6]